MSSEGNRSSSQAEAPQMENQQSTPQQSTLDVDLQRAHDLVFLRYEVKMKYLESGLDPELLQAEKDVDRVLLRLHG